MSTTFENLLAQPENRKIYEQERILLDTTELLATVMHQRKISRAELAKRVGKSKSFITQVLRGDQNLTLRTIADLFFALDYRVGFKALPMCCEADGTAMSEFELGDWNHVSAFSMAADEDLGLKIRSENSSAPLAKVLPWKGVAA